MNAFWMLLPASIVNAGASMLSYQPHLRERWWFIVVIASCSTLNGLTWSIASRLSINNRELFTLSLIWDAIAIFSYSVLPIMVCGVRLSPVAWSGFAMVVMGAIIVHRN